jgi:hypothetical protein
MPEPRSTAPRPSGPSARPSSGAVDATRVTGAGVLAFAIEVAMVVLLAVAGARLGGNRAVSVLLAVVLVAAAVVVWGRWLAPRAPRRMARTPRLAAKAVLFAATALLAIASGLVVVAIVFVVVAGASLAWSRD